MLIALLLMVLSARCALSSGCHPECRWACDDPVCPAVCGPVCEPPACVLVNATDPACASFQPQCHLQCPVDQCESDECPTCETACAPPSGRCDDGTIVCEAPQCAWRCAKPQRCPYPRCELQCEQPACQAAAGAARAAVATLVGLIVAFSIIF